MKRSKTELLRLTARQGQTARAELLQASERAQLFEGSARYLCDLLGVLGPDAAASVRAAADRIRAMIIANAELDALRGENARLRADLEALRNVTVTVGLDEERVHQRVVETAAAPGTRHPLAGEVA